MFLAAPISSNTFTATPLLRLRWEIGPIIAIGKRPSCELWRAQPKTSKAMEGD